MPAERTERRDTRGRGRKRGFILRKRRCRFCADKSEIIDYKRSDMLQRFITERGKILTRRVSGNCAKHQRQLATAVKRARFIALLPYVEE